MDNKKKKPIMTYPPDDVIFNILRRLPGKSLVRFKCVCKFWRSFINTLRYNNPKLILLSSSSVKSVDFQSSTVEAVPIDLPIECSELYVAIGSCDGLFCILIKNKSLKKETFLWNPHTGKYNRLPIPETKIPSGLGYDHSTNDYKIVRLNLDQIGFYNFETLFEIYSLNTDSLDRGMLPWVLEFFHIRGTSVNGALYWPTRFVKTLDLERESCTFEFVCPTFDKLYCYSILCLDLTNKKFSVIHLPDGLGKKRKLKFHLIDFGGRLCVAYYHDAGHIDMWIMENFEGQNWIKLMSIPRSEELNYQFYYLVPVYFFKNGEVLLNIRYIGSGSYHGLCTNRFRIYNPEEKKLKLFKIKGSQEFDQLLPYTESLTSPIVNP